MGFSRCPQQHRHPCRRRPEQRRNQLVRRLNRNRDRRQTPRFRSVADRVCLARTRATGHRWAILSCRDLPPAVGARRVQSSVRGEAPNRRFETLAYDGWLIETIRVVERKKKWRLVEGRSLLQQTPQTSRQLFRRYVAMELQTDEPECGLRVM